MCGIIGCINKQLSFVKEFIQPAMASLFHRGPDDQGVWIDEQLGVALGHTRLSIVDLSPQGHQPMHSPQKRYTNVFNGEIYNYRNLRKELENRKHIFKGHSDTEIMLAGFEEWGIEATIQRSIGMFAFAIWDNFAKKLFLIRDRLGEKPLYYGWHSGSFFFTSELKALKTNSGFNPPIDRDALALYFRYGYIPTPYSIYEGIYKLPQASIIELSLEQLYHKPSNFSPYPDTLSLSPKRYWSAKKIFIDTQSASIKVNDKELQETFEEILKDAIRLQMVADVPVGAFLSGGVDSSTIVALMQLQNTVPIKTYSIGFYESRYNEATHAKLVADHLGTQHQELYLTPEECMNVIPLIPTLYDEPFADSSQIPTYLVAKLARQEVTVSLSGDGGDELFGGYPRYLWASHIWDCNKYCPSTIRLCLGKLLKQLHIRQWDSLLERAKAILPKSFSFHNPGSKLHKLANILEAKKPIDLYYKIISLFQNPTNVVLGSKEPPVFMTMEEELPKNANFMDLMMFIDLLSYFPDDILTKVDRASMGVSLESRAPFLDHRVVEFALSLPLQMKIRNGQTKWLLRQVLYKYVPFKLVDRPKMGFGVPLEHWLRGPLREWAEELLSEQVLIADGYLNSKLIRKKWNEHLLGDKDWQNCLWPALMFNTWLRHCM